MRAATAAEAEAVAREIEALGGKALVHIGDVADAKAVQAMADAAAKHFGRIDILVNNAALRREKPFAEMDYAEWREILDVTLDGAFHCVKACLPGLRKSGAGTIVNIGGLSAHTGAKNRAHVVTAKAGIVGFTRALAHDLAADGITVNCVVPGLIGTPRPKDRPRTRASSDPPDHHRRARQAGRRRGRGAIPVRPGRALHHRAGHPRQWRGLSRRLAHGALPFLQRALPDKCARRRRLLMLTIGRMNQQAKIEIRHSTCPHDCPSACALDVEVIDGSSIGRVRGSKLQTYTAGVSAPRSRAMPSASIIRTG